jgi:hypothetical protein
MGGQVFRAHVRFGLDDSADSFRHPVMVDEV